MATSGSVDFNVTAEEIIEHALRKCGVFKDAIPSVFRKQLDPALKELNMLVKARHADGLQMWKTQRVKITTALHKNKYQFGTYAYGIQSVKQATHAIAAGVATDTTIDVAGTTALFADADPIEIHQSDGTVLSTTVNGAPSGISGGVRLTLTDALTASVAIGAQVDTWKTETRVPLRVISAFYRDTSGATTSTSDIPMTMISRQEYWNTVNNKRADGKPYQAFFDRQLDTGFLYIDTESDDTDVEIHLLCQMPVEDFDSISDNPDFPREWMLYLVYGLADILADNYPELPGDRRAMITAKARMLKQEVMEFDTEYDTSIFFSPSTER